MKNFAIFAGAGCGGFIVVLILVLIGIGMVAPETSIYTGRQVPGRYLKVVKSLGLLEEGEKIKYFYSDAFFDIKKGFYFVTEKKLVVYSTEWEEPSTIVPFTKIQGLDVEFSDSFLEDTWVTVIDRDGREVSFPISRELGRDKKFVKFISERSDIPEKK